MHKKRNSEAFSARGLLAAVVVCLGFASPATANVHYWQVSELYSSADGTVQYIEMYTPFDGQEYFKSFGNNTELKSQNAAGTVTHDSYPIPQDSPAPTGNHHVLFGTSNLATTLNVTPDYILPTGNFLLTGVAGYLAVDSPNWGDFAGVSYPILPGGSNSYEPFVGSVPGTPTNYAGVVGTFPSPAIPGDFDSDNDVDGADFVVWQTNFPKQTGGTLATGDSDGDGDVDGADFVVWQTHFPYPTGTAVVPEPSAVLLAAIGLVVGYVRRRRIQALATA